MNVTSLKHIQSIERKYPRIADVYEIIDTKELEIEKFKEIRRIKVEEFSIKVDYSVDDKGIQEMLNTQHAMYNLNTSLTSVFSTRCQCASPF